MKRIYSLLACFIIGVVFINYRISYPENKTEQNFKVTTWDALGYYMYLPAVFIYNDVTKLAWLPQIDQKYGLSGGVIYQANRIENGNYVGKYLGGVAVLEMPFFFIGHIIAVNSAYEADGFSPPYQYAISYGILCYFLLGIFLLRKVLLFYFSDLTTALTLLLLSFASNIVQYAACDSAQSHIPIFFLYCVVLYSTIRWHQTPTLWWASLTGFVIGLATISRPTEAIMFLIPLLWNTHTKELAAEKWAMLRMYKVHVICIMVAGIIGILPQLVYWKMTTGHFVYDVGSKWTFLNPFFRVLFGFEKGWFIYTPITILFVTGLFFVKQYPFRKSVIWFCLLNIYIIISWFDWRYGGSYSTRALVQSYPVFALPFAAVIEWINAKKWRFVFYGAGAYLIFVNLFQVWQYNRGMLLYDGMTREYYGRIYLNSAPTALDMSLLDTDEWLKNEDNYEKEVLLRSDSTIVIAASEMGEGLAETNIALRESAGEIPDNWLKIEASIKIGTGGGRLRAQVQLADSVKYSEVRLWNPVTQPGQYNPYAFYIKVPYYFKQSRFQLLLIPSGQFEGQIEHITITQYKK